MALNLYMVGLTVRDMVKALEFYRRLGLAVPDGSAERRHVEVKMGDAFTFFLDTRSFGPDTPPRAEAEGRQRVLLEFYLPSRAAVDAKCAELTGFGYRSYPAPVQAPPGMYFAFIEDPDGNPILLSAAADPAS